MSEKKLISLSKGNYKFPTNVKSDEFIGFLRICLFENLSENYSNENDMRYAFLNFIYTGEWTPSNKNFIMKLTVKTNEVFKASYKEQQIWQHFEKVVDSGDETKLDDTDFPKHIFNTLIDGWNKTAEIHNKLMSSLKDKKLKYLVACESPRYNPCKDETVRLNYLLQLGYESYNEPTGPYFNPIKQAVCKILEVEQVTNMIDSLRDFQIGFFDIIPFPIPISSKLRKEWNTAEVFKIGPKEIFLVPQLFELALENLKTHKIEITCKTKVAICMPNNTSIGLYNYLEEFEGKNFLTITDRISCMILKQKPFGKLKKEWKIKLRGETLPRYQSNVMSGSNTPSELLIKLAWDLKP